ncbi:hypothetical protein EVAR_38704_1 [Eumeta japonica]|uniref:Uncharacterized protein n=1 Tax=Eumeta variegata TaxID=151549 RepID=A0A4C1XPP2_EUMVA|nr:hypothetical protein EVAR_38704_1 [Eumeta japonica]
MAQKEEETEYVFHIDDDVEIDCTIGGVETKMLIDSGCKQNLITKATWETLKKNKVILNNQHPNPNVTFMAYGDPDGYSAFTVLVSVYVQLEQLNELSCTDSVDTLDCLPIVCMNMSFKAHE